MSQYAGIESLTSIFPSHPPNRNSSPSAIADASNIPHCGKSNQTSVDAGSTRDAWIHFFTDLWRLPTSDLRSVVFRTRSSHAVVIVRPLGGAFPAPVHKPPAAVSVTPPGPSPEISGTRRSAERYGASPWQPSPEPPDYEKVRGGSLKLPWN